MLKYLLLAYVLIGFVVSRSLNFNATTNNLHLNISAFQSCSAENSQQFSDCYSDWGLVMKTILISVLQESTITPKIVLQMKQQCAFSEICFKNAGCEVPFLIDQLCAGVDILSKPGFMCVLKIHSTARNEVACGGVLRLSFLQIGSGKYDDLIKENKDCMANYYKQKCGDAIKETFSNQKERETTNTEDENASNAI
ncbi:unnamed protein product [Caenorhabditis bovis]|uniref:DUF19 domain-containing protein n=1 Tax=Caenorhabditis bovis TaxID=2654633 RepID=A0A8S1ER86_9PELO|nr:unnamed protein product [Caenorhabditis bovis]